MVNYFKEPFGPDIAVEVTKNGGRQYQNYVVTKLGERLRINPAIDIAIGAQVEPKAKLLLKRIDATKKYNAGIQKMKEGKVALDVAVKEALTHFAKFDDEVMGAREFSLYFDLVDPKTMVNECKIGVTLRLSGAVEPMEYAKSDLIKLKATPEMLAVIAKRMGCGVAQVGEWLSDADSEKAKVILRDADERLRELTLPYEVTKITAVLSVLMSDIDAEVKRRKVEFVNAVEAVVKERFNPIR